MKWFRVGLLVVVTIFGWLVTYVSKISTTEARVKTLEHEQIKIRTEVSDFKSTISKQLGKIEGQNDMILRHLIKNDSK